MSRGLLLTSAILWVGSGCGASERTAGTELPATSAVAPASASAELVASASAAPATSASARPAAPPEFTLGCEPQDSKDLPPRVDLARADDDAHWLWACRAVGKLGAPTLRDSGFPDFHLHDRRTGGCFVLELDDVGAHLYKTPPDRADAVRAFLSEGTPKDCAFEVGLDGGTALPSRAGVRNGAPFHEAIYALGTLDGARKFFDEHPHERSAGHFLNAYLELPTKKRPTDLGAMVDKAVVFELDAFDRMDRAWLSDIGKQGYCVRAKDLAKLSTASETKKRAQAEVARFCK